MKLRGKLFIVTALILSMLLGLTCLAFAQPADIQGHWAEAQIGKWLEQKLATGYPDGSFGPDNSITRAEFVALVNRVFGFTASEPINYPDVAPDAWFSDEIAKAKAAGYLSGYEDGTIRPNGQISRQEAALILAKVLQLDLNANPDGIEKFKDAATIPAWSKGAIAAVEAKGIITGYPDQTCQPAKQITRAEAIVILDRAVQNTGETTDPGQGSNNGDGGGVKPIVLDKVEYFNNKGEALADANAVSANPLIKLTFSNGLRDNYQKGVYNEQKITLHKGTENGEVIAVDVYMQDPPASGEDTEKRSFYIKPQTSLEAGQTYVIVIDGSFQANNGQTLGTDAVIKFTVKATAGSGKN